MQKPRWRDQFRTRAPEPLTDRYQLALNLGMDRRFVLHTPLMWIDKAETWKMAEDLGGTALVELVRDRTHTCYLGVRDVRHDWGYGCGSCPACELRAKGFAGYRAR